MECIQIIDKFLEKTDEELLVINLDNLGEEIVKILTEETDFDKLDKLLIRLNTLADKKKKNNLLLPAVHAFQIYVDQHQRRLTGVEATVFHFVLAEPQQTLIDTTKLLNATYTSANIKPLLLRAFLYWGGCLSLRKNQIKKAIQFFYNCCGTPAEKKELSNFGIEASKKLLMLSSSQGNIITPPSPYSRVVPKYIRTLCDSCMNRNINKVINNLKSSSEKLIKDGNLEVAHLLLYGTKVLAIKKYSIIYSTIELKELSRKVGLESSELAEIIEKVATTEGKDWFVANSIVTFGFHDTIPDITDDVKQLQQCEICIGSMNEHLRARDRNRDNTKSKK
ncbi:PCI domain-containing protein [Entamoeba marina]